jgi:class 3 adenylate cyclase
LVIELAADAGATDLVREAAEFLDELERRGQRFTTTMGLFIPRMLGVAAQTVGDTTRARTWLHESIDLATRLRAHAELAASQYALASLLAQEGDAAAAPLVETAHRATRALGMLPLAARCAELAQRLGVPRAATQDVHDAPDAQYGGIGATQMAVVVFMDIADSVALTEELGDWVFYDRSRALQASLRAVIKSFAGSPVEGIKLGDGILAEFGSAERAVSCALACSSLAYDTGLPVHIGAHAGDVVRGDGDIFGGTVNTAARICSHASAGEIIVSRTIRDLARTSSTVQFASLGAETFKGIAEPVQLYSVHAG